MAFVTQVLLPKRDNLGRPFGKEGYHSFHRRMIRKFGGWTRKGQAEGAWLASSGRFYADQHWVYEIGHARRELVFWQAEKERLKREFEQEEIWIMQYEGRLI
jgi:hypothetical protein